VGAQHERLGVFHAAFGVEQFADGAHRVQHAQLVRLVEARQHVAHFLARAAVQRLVDGAAMFGQMQQLGAAVGRRRHFADQPAPSNLAMMRLR
jgi:hypothetical protein